MYNAIENNQVDVKRLQELVAATATRVRRLGRYARLVGGRLTEAGEASAANPEDGWRRPY